MLVWQWEHISCDTPVWSVRIVLCKKRERVFRECLIAPACINTDEKKWGVGKYSLLSYLLLSIGVLHRICWREPHILSDCIRKHHCSHPWCSVQSRSIINCYVFAIMLWSLPNVTSIYWHVRGVLTWHAGSLITLKKYGNQENDAQQNVSHSS
jgi:hypothetical protein